MKLERIWKGILIVTLGFGPILFNPLMVDVFGFGKQTLLGVGLVLSLLFFGLSYLVKKQDHLVWGKMLSWGALMLVVGVLSWKGMDVGGRWRSWHYPWGLGSLVWIWLAWFLMVQAGERVWQKLMLVWIWIGIGVTLLSLFLFLAPGKFLPIALPSKDMPWISLGPGFSLFGGLLDEIVFLGLLFAFTTRGVYLKFREKSEYLVITIMGAILLLGTVIGVYRAMRLPVPMLDLGTSWTIAMEGIKNQPVVGMGVGNYLEGFYKYRGAAFNNSYWWASGFLSGTGGAMTWIAETGLMGLVLLVAGAMAIVKKGWQKRSLWIVLVAVVAPWSITGAILVGLVWLLMGGERDKRFTLVLNAGENLNVFPWMLFAIMLAVVMGLGWSLFGSIKSEYYWKKSLLSASKNDGNGTYSNQQMAILASANNADLRRNFAQTNFSLAQALLSSAKDNLNAETQKNVSTLLGQAVSEAKSAIALEPKNPVAWVALAGIYRGMVGIVDGTADWALQSYQQAITLDPANPVILVEVGGIYYGSGNFESADRVFEQAVNAKPTLANSWYNWAWANYQLAQTNKQNTQYYGQKLTLATNYLQQAINLVGPDSSDYSKADEELGKWKEELKRITPPDVGKQVKDEVNEVLKKPEALPTVVVGKEERVNVTKEQLEPPVVEPTPTDGPGGP